MNLNLGGEEGLREVCPLEWLAFTEWVLLWMYMDDCCPGKDNVKCDLILSFVLQLFVLLDDFFKAHCKMNKLCRSI